jgi:8-oxo-dGTP pyrophosphatase MutT (NUDIX family)
VRKTAVGRDRYHRAVIKHATASTFVMHRDEAGWRTGLVLHPILDTWIMPGGHIDPDEDPPQAALREVAEETGLHPVRLLPWHEPPAVIELPTARPVLLPWWILEHPIDGDNHLAEPHLHVDHKYVAIAESTTPASPPAHPFAWHRPDELDDLRMFDDVRLIVRAVVAELSDAVSDTARGR